VPFLFETLQLWIDESARSGPENMAVDEWLLANVEQPLLRVYRWEGNWGSLGYFGSIAEARETFPGVNWVRRWTGGGLVDHRDDWTYTLVVPIRDPLARQRGAESYRLIHEALGQVLESGDVRLSSGREVTGAAACFENPVEHDLVDAAGRKRAGAGQRRTRTGLLHQGSVCGRLEIHVSRERAEALAEGLAAEARDFQDRPGSEEIGRLVGRYMETGWTDRR
jgi:lipoyl(octanoyl) transferase